MNSVWTWICASHQRTRLQKRPFESCSNMKTLTVPWYSSLLPAAPMDLDRYYLATLPTLLLTARRLLRSLYRLDNITIYLYFKSTHSIKHNTSQIFVDACVYNIFDRKWDFVVLPRYITSQNMAQVSRHFLKASLILKTFDVYNKMEYNI